MAYIRPQPKQRISKEERNQLLQEYYLYYKELIHEQGIEALNLKIPREVFASVLDEVGSLLQERAAQLLSESEAVRQFLEKTPVPPSMASQLPEDFRVFALLLNALKQWVSAESAATDRFLLGGNARKECREVTNTCLVTGKEIGDDGELHHPVRDGRPPVLLSREGHNIIEYGQKKRGEGHNRRMIFHGKSSASADQKVSNHGDSLRKDAAILSPLSPFAALMLNHLLTK